MPDILLGETAKKVIRAAEKLVLWKLKTDIDVMAQDMEHCPNPVFKSLYQTILAAGSYIQHNHQKNVVQRLGAKLGVWILYKDTAYRDVTIWILYQILKRADTLLPLVKQYYKEPEDWYPNLWEDSMKHSKKLKEKGEIPDHKKSPLEEIFVPK